MSTPTITQVSTFLAKDCGFPLGDASVSPLSVKLFIKYLMNGCEHWYEDWLKPEADTAAEISRAISRIFEQHA